MQATRRPGPTIPAPPPPLKLSIYPQNHVQFQIFAITVSDYVLACILKSLSLGSPPHPWQQDLVGMSALYCWHGKQANLELWSDVIRAVHPPGRQTLNQCSALQPRNPAGTPRATLCILICLVGEVLKSGEIVMLAARCDVIYGYSFPTSQAESRSVCREAEEEEMLERDQRRRRCGWQKVEFQHL